MAPQNQGRAWPDISGRIEGQRHVLPVRVYFEDTDFTGLVYHASFVRFIERGRSDFIRLLGLHHSELEKGEGAGGGEPSVFVVRRMEMDFLRPAHIDDLLEVVTELAELGGASLTLNQEIHHNGRTIFRAKVVIVLISKSGKPQRMNALMKSAFTQLSSPQEPYT